MQFWKAPPTSHVVTDTAMPVMTITYETVCDADADGATLAKKQTNTRTNAQADTQANTQANTNQHKQAQPNTNQPKPIPSLGLEMLNPRTDDYHIFESHTTSLPQWQAPF